MNPSRPQSQSLLPPVRAATGYSVVLPPGWRKIPLRTGTEKAIRAVVREAFTRLPRDAPPDKVGPHRLQLERTLTRMVRDARGKGGIDLYLPAGPVYGAPLAASFIVSELSLGPADPASIAAMLEAEDDAMKAVTMDGADGLRAERTAAPAPEHDVDFASRRLASVVDAYVVGPRVLELLQHRAGGAGGEEVAGQQQHRDAVDRRERGSGHHIGRARADRGRARERLQPVPHPGEADRRVHHRLLVAGQVIPQVRLAGFVGLEQRLADARHVAVPEDAEAARDEPLLHAVARAVLAAKEPHQSLGDGKADGAHVHPFLPVAEVRGSRGSMSWSGQVPRIQAWAGSSQKRQARSPAGPAMTLR